MDDSKDQDNGSSVHPFIQHIPNDERTAHTYCTRQRIIFLVVCGGIATIALSAVTGTILYSRYEKPSPPEHFIENNSCLFQDFTKGVNDTLGDRCLHGSKFVKEYCGPEGVQACDPCEKHLLPKFCFCVKGDECGGADLLRKKTCMDCTTDLYCPCLNGGSCVCKSGKHLTGHDMKCMCPEGYDGDYCGIIPNRKCVRNNTVAHLNHCKESQDPQCFIRDSAQNSSLICTILIAQKDIAELEECPEK